MTQLEQRDIQAIVFTGYPKNPYAMYLLLEVLDAGRARRYLARVADALTTGEPRTYGATTNLALTADGLRALGLPERSLATFSREFREGMSGAEHRSRILGDTDDSAPEQWLWGARGAPVHLMLMLFAPDEAQLVNAREASRADYAGALREVFVRDTVTLPERREHFGFADGIAQPRIAGSEGERPDVAAIQPGEFIFGYPNEYDKTPVSPSVARGLDAARHLSPVLGAGGAADRDLGRNGSYLVVRQLEQRVDAFWSAMADYARDGAGAVDEQEAIRLASKCVGRWPSGAPLVATPDRDDPALRNANDFMYAKEDPNGQACPIGAHIRRTNPRDSLEPGPEASLRVVDRHRILRRGRSYGKPLAPFAHESKLAERGLFFICVNANIRRQFEFIQQTWSNNTKFGGLYEDKDPLTGDQPVSGGTYTIPGLPVRRRLEKLARFVRVRGGAYFFLPSVHAVRFLGALQGPTIKLAAGEAPASERA